MGQKALFVFAAALLAAPLSVAQDVLQRTLLNTPLIAEPTALLSVIPTKSGAGLIVKDEASPLFLTPSPPQIYAVRPGSYNWQLCLSYSFFRFYMLPSQINNYNGISFSVARFFGDYFGVEGDVTSEEGQAFGVSNANFTFISGGFRARYPNRSRYEPWGHVLLGYAHETPRTAFGSERTFGYALGVGIDTKILPRISIRTSVDGIGTLFFSSYQFSPKASAGVVFNF